MDSQSNTRFSHGDCGDFMTRVSSTSDPRSTKQGSHSKLSFSPKSSFHFASTDDAGALEISVRIRAWWCNGWCVIFLRCFFFDIFGKSFSHVLAAHEYKDLTTQLRRRRPAPSEIEVRELECIDFDIEPSASVQCDFLTQFSATWEHDDSRTFTCADDSHGRSN